MAGNTFKQPEKKSKKSTISSASVRKKLDIDLSFLKDPRVHLAFGVFLLVLSFFLFFSFFSYFFTMREDQSLFDVLGDQSVVESGREVENWFGVLGAWLSHQFIYKWFGIASFLITLPLVVFGVKLVWEKTLMPIKPMLKGTAFFIFWITLFLGYLSLNAKPDASILLVCGGYGYEIANLVNSLTGWGTILILLFFLVLFVIFFFDIKPKQLMGLEPIEGEDEEFDEEHNQEDQGEPEGLIEVEDELAITEAEMPTMLPVVEEAIEPLPVIEPITEPGASIEFETPETPLPRKKVTEIPDLELATVEPVAEDAVVESDPVPIAEKIDIEVEKSPEDILAEENENYDPTLDLASYQYPTIELLDDHSGSKVQVSREELEANKNNIVTTLANYKIGISSIKATIGPTVTLYEIVPEAGVKISKIKNLEDDIALSLAALGIRIIAPIPGKGTIGIEVPNKNREMVSSRSVISTEKFMKSEMDLPVVFGKTISNETFVIDLAKMPHILMAGATGQGKSVGLNIILASLLYKKHPSQLKFILVDPKKVELSVFSKIERHFLAMLPDGEEAIITDTKLVINTLNSLCIEMDTRYDLLKDAGCRNLKEYNQKFIKRRLSPEKGHRFMPYIVLVIDELADLMMTAGKEVETPIARLAQLARAIGIHLIVATQRPSVNVITGTIKANFPARISFKVTSKIDSRTILDAGGADQLVGMGDMLFTQGADVTRVQCAFIDTPEVERIVDFIGEQRAYDSAYMLPEFIDESAEQKAGDVDLSSRDALFDDAARIIVMHQQGSTSLVQRKLKLGYNRAGRIIDQLEAAGVVGQFEGSKARKVLVPDEFALEQLLNSL